MVTAEQYNDLRVQEQQGQIMADNLKKKKKKVKMTVDGYYTDDNGSWTIYKTPTGMTVMKKGIN
jgi:hypothetical protein